MKELIDRLIALDAGGGDGGGCRDTAGVIIGNGGLDGVGVLRRGRGVIVLVLMGVLRRPAWQASLAGLIVGLIIAIWVWQMPAGLAARPRR